MPYNVLCKALQSTAFFLWGASGSGLSHLLQASCHLANQLQLRAQYLPLADLVGFAPDALLEGMDGFDLLCLDGLEHVVGKGRLGASPF